MKDLKNAPFTDRLKPEQKKALDEVLRMAEKGTTYAAACRQLGIAPSSWNHIRSMAIHGSSYGSAGYAAAREGAKKSAAKSSSYTAVTVAAPHSRPQELTIPLSSDPKGPVVMIFGTQAQLATLLREAMTK